MTILYRNSFASDGAVPAITERLAAKGLLLHAERVGLVKMTPVYSIWKIVPILLSLSVEISSVSGIDNLFNYGIFAGLCRGW